MRARIIMQRQENWLRRTITQIASTRAGGWIILKVLTPIDRVLLRVSGGRIATTALMLPSLVLISTGAKSGQPRETPLIYLPDGERIVLMASNVGMPHHPAWYHNLRANPVAQVAVGGRTMSYRAREAAGAEREQLWRRAVALYPGYAVYQGRAEGRTIPVLVLEPVV
jgi:deazaflavin-dependent oxidoreductase (nitroreductase family)